MLPGETPGLDVLREHLDVAEMRRGLAAGRETTIDMVDVADEDIDAGE